MLRSSAAAQSLPSASRDESEASESWRLQPARPGQSTRSQFRRCSFADDGSDSVASSGSSGDDTPWSSSRILATFHVGNLPHCSPPSAGSSANTVRDVMCSH
jgi:hypothetical protein